MENSFPYILSHHEPLIATLSFIDFYALVLHTCMIFCRLTKKKSRFPFQIAYDINLDREMSVERGRRRKGELTVLLSYYSNHNRLWNSRGLLDGSRGTQKANSLLPLNKLLNFYSPNTVCRSVFETSSRMIASTCLVLCTFVECIKVI